MNKKTKTSRQQTLIWEIGVAVGFFIKHTTLSNIFREHLFLHILVTIKVRVISLVIPDLLRGVAYIPVLHT